MGERSEHRGFSNFARRWVERKFERLYQSAHRGSGTYYELYSQNFTDRVDGLLERVKRQDLRDHILEKARSGGDYVEGGRWKYDNQAEDVVFCETPQKVTNKSGPQQGAAAQLFSPGHETGGQSPKQETKAPRLTS